VFGSADLERCFKSTTALHFSASLINNSISLKIAECLKEKVRLLVDTGSDVNMIKFSEFKKKYSGGQNNHQQANKYQFANSVKDQSPKEYNL